MHPYVIKHPLFYCIQEHRDMVELFIGKHIRDARGNARGIIETEESRRV